MARHAQLLGCTHTRPSCRGRWPFSHLRPSIDEKGHLVQLVELCWFGCTNMCPGWFIWLCVWHVRMGMGQDYTSSSTRLPIFWPSRLYCSSSRLIVNSIHTTPLHTCQSFWFAGWLLIVNSIHSTPLHTCQSSGHRDFIAVQSGWLWILFHGHPSISS